MEISLLGPLEVAFDQVRLDVPGQKLRTLLAVFGLSASTAISRDQLIDELWPQAPPKDAANALQVHILRLRQLLAAYAGAPAARALLVTSSAGYCLQVPPGSVDANRFTELAAQAQQPGRDAAARRQVLVQALDLWRGPALLDIGDSMTCRIAAVRLEEARLMAQEELFDAELSLHMHSAAVPLLEQFTARYPLRERFCEQLMVALYRCSRQADAIDVYHRVRHRLQSELGLEPSESIRSRYQQILRQAVR
jgi:SARP family transcriptional regulator, regulator of embCAB operon